MSANTSTTTGPSTEPDRLAALEERLDELEATVEQQQETIDEQNATIAELQDELESRAAVRWESDNNKEISVEPSTDDAPFPLGRALSAKVGETEFENLREELWQLKVDGVDAADLVGLTGDDEPALPIEDTIAALRSDVRDDPSANKARATVLFRAFGGRATATKGGKLVLKSPAARSILEDPEKGDMDDVNNNTLKRTMHQCAKLTSPHATPRDRDARSPDNLITVEERDGKLALVADSDDWHGYLQEVEQRYQ